MAADAIQNLLNNRDAIRKIMSMEGQMDKIAENARNGGHLSMSNEGVEYSGNYEMAMHPNSDELVINEASMSKSKLPRQIVDSFRKSPGNTSNTSILDALPQSVLKENTAKPKKQVVSESATQSYSPIDYSLLRTIINEAVETNVKKYMSALSKKLLNENTGGDAPDMMAMKIGKGFSFIDAKGNVYTATLQKKGSVNG